MHSASLGARCSQVILGVRLRSGLTVFARPRHGIVAVDPRVIPLGSHLYIPGYGRATAGDTGGAIQGNRIDLGFNSSTDALQFGRRSVTVYVLHP